MKKIFFLLCSAMVLFCGQSLFAQEGQPSDNQITETQAGEPVEAADSELGMSDAYIETEQAIKKAGRFFKSEEIAVPALKLTDEERSALYDEYRKNTKKAALLNGLVGFGSGSFATQGYISGSLLLAGEGVCWYYTCLGAWLIWGNPSDDLGAAFGALFGAVLLVGGGACIIGSRFIGAGVASANTASYNRKLKNSLGARDKEKTDVSFAPVFNPFTNDAGLVVSLKL